MKEKLSIAGFWGAIILVLAMIGAVIFFPAKNRRNALADTMGVTERIGKVLPLGTRFTNETGEKVLLSDYFRKGRSVLLVPMFYDCKGACMMISEATIEAAIGVPETTGTMYDIVVFSINSKETPEMALKRRDYMLKWYAKKTPRPGAEKGWHCLTGNDESIQAVTSALGYKFTKDPKTGQLNHPAAVAVVSPDGLISQYFYGTEYPSRLVGQSLRDAKENKLETLTQEKRLVGCFQFNPVTGRYVFQASVALRRAAEIMVVGTFLSIMYLTFRYRKNPVPAEAKQEEVTHGE